MCRGVRYSYTPGREEGPTIVLVHGLGNSLDFWTAIAPRLGERFPTLAFDVPGFGESDTPPGSFSFEAAADFVEPLLDDLEIGSCLVVGHSLGGLLALTMALRLPNVMRLVLVDATLQTAAECLKNPTVALRHPKIASATLAQFAGGTLPLDATRARLLSGNSIGRCLALRPYLHRPASVDTDLLALALAGNSGRNILNTFRAGNSIDVRKLMGSVQMPVDLVWGAHDPLLTSDDIASASQLMQVVDRLEIPGCSHWPMIEAPEPLSRFISSSAQQVSR